MEKVPANSQFERAIDGFLREQVSEPPVVKIHGKRKHCDEATTTIAELQHSFFRTLRERNLLSLWMDKKVLNQHRWRITKIDDALNAVNESELNLKKAQRGLDLLIRDLTTTLYSDLFAS